MTTDTKFLVSNFDLCTKFANLGPTSEKNDLLPNVYEKKPTAYMKQIRKDSQNFDWDDSGKTYLFAESLGVVCNAYIKVSLAAHQTGNYKDMPGLHIVRTSMILF